MDDGEGEETQGEDYWLASRDIEVVASTVELLEKIRRADFTQPAELVTVATALHIFRRLPRASASDVELDLSLSGPKKRFGAIEVLHHWSVHVSAGRVSVISGGGYYDPATGSDSFTCLMWSAAPGAETSYEDWLHLHWMVPDGLPFPEEVARLDLNQPGFVLDDVYHTGNLLLDEREEYVESAPEYDDE